MGRNKSELLIIMGSFLISLLLGAVLIAVFGANPITAYAEMLSGAFSDSGSALATLARIVPIALSTLCISVAFNAGIWNIGAEGQLFVGAFSSAAFGILFGANIPALILIPAGILAGMIAAMLWAYIPGKLALDKGLNIVVLTIMLNSIATLLTSYLTVGPFASANASAGSTDKIPEAMRFMQWNIFSTLNSGVMLAIVAIAVVSFMMMYTVSGYEWRMCRMNTRFALYGGIDVRKMQMSAMMISGALAGLTGALLVMGDHYRFLVSISPGYTWTGMILAMMIGYHPIGGLVASIIYSVMSAGALQMELVNDVPVEVVEVIVCCAVLLVTAGIAISNRMANRLRED